MLVMPDSPQQFYDKVEKMSRKKLIVFVVPLFVLFIVVGFVIGNVIQRPLKNNEEAAVTETTEPAPKESTSLKGKVVYVDPNFYPRDDISYYLEDESGSKMILLKADDAKLTVVEGLDVVVFGEMGETENGEEEVLLVEKVVVKK
jgi:hypothetical protein